VKSGIAEEDFERAFRRWIFPKDRFHLLPDLPKHGNLSDAVRTQ